jgi:hypothetical protein
VGFAASQASQMLGNLSFCMVQEGHTHELAMLEIMVRV